MSPSQIPGAPLEIVPTRKCVEEMELSSPLGILPRITERFSYERVIGEGGYGAVYKGRLKNGEIAVKKLLPGINDTLVNEIPNLKIKHDGLVHRKCVEEMELSSPLGILPRITERFSYERVIGEGGYGAVYSVHHPLVQMVLFAWYEFGDSFYCCESIYDMAMRLCSSVWTIVCGTDWISASRKSDAPKMGTISEFDTMNNIGWRKEPAENQSHHSDPDSSRAEHGIKAVGRKTPAAWVIATGAPHHATGNRGLLSGFITEHNDQFVHAADGVPMRVLARGAMVTDAVVLPDVWFVPGLTANLVSVSQLTELDYNIGFGCGECCISAAGKVVGKAHLQEGGLYVLDFLKVPLAL